MFIQLNIFRQSSFESIKQKVSKNYSGPIFQILPIKFHLSEASLQ